MSAVDASRGEHLLGPDHTELFTELVPDEVLSSIAASQGKVGQSQPCSRETTRLSTG
jgi:hypothetical protein